MAKRRTPEQLAADEEARTRRLRAKLEAQQITAALAYYTAAGKGRRNKDFRAPMASADLAIIPDQSTLIARSRSTVANTWVGKAAERAQKRNVAGRGIMTVPTASDKDGKDLPAINKSAANSFLRWASDRTACDLEKRRTYWQQQRMIVGEEFVAGESLLVWSYSPHPTRVGLKLQVVEPEQFDLTKTSHDGREIRGGIEVDENGAAVAYHLYPRNPNDYSYWSRPDSMRVPAERVFHYFDAERTQQSHGVTKFAPVLQDTRDLNSFREATLWRARMEACIGYIIRRNQPTGLGVSPTVPYPAGDSGQTSSGMRTLGVTPGMVPELMPGEDVTPFIPSSPGNMYDPFTTLTLRGVGAGMGMSFGALTRHNDANYSAARQDMLEDEREIGPQQDLFIDLIAMPVYELWFYFAVYEGKIPGLTMDELLSDPDRYLDAEYIPPARPWIDPEKEANAWEKALKLRIVTRKEIIAQQGGRLQNLLQQSKNERDEAASYGITFPEDLEAQSTEAKTKADEAKAAADLATAANPPTATGEAAATPLDQVKATADAYGVGVRAGVLTPQVADEEEFRKKLSLPVLSNESKEAWEKDGGARRPITITQPTDAAPATPFGDQAALAIGPGAIGAPNYRPAAEGPMRCGTCSLFKDGKCTAYDFNATPACVCDAWEASATLPSGGKSMGPQRQDGEPGLDNPGGFDSSAR